MQTNNPARSLTANLATDHEVAEAFGVGISTVRRWRIKDGLPFVKVGGRPLIDVEDARRWLASRKVGAGGAR